MQTNSVGDWICLAMSFGGFIAFILGSDAILYKAAVGIAPFWGGWVLHNKIWNGWYA